MALLAQLVPSLRVLSLIFKTFPLLKVRFYLTFSMIMVVCIVSGVAVIAVNQSSGNDVNGQYFRHYSHYFSFSVDMFSH